MCRILYRPSIARAATIVHFAYFLQPPRLRALIRYHVGESPDRRSVPLEVRWYSLVNPESLSYACRCCYIRLVHTFASPHCPLGYPVRLFVPLNPIVSLDPHQRARAFLHLPHQAFLNPGLGSVVLQFLDPLDDSHAVQCHDIVLFPR